MSDVKTISSPDSRRSQSHPRRFPLVALIAATLIVAAPLRCATGRSIIFEDLVEHQERYKRSLKLIPCAATFIQEYLESPNQMALLLPDAARDVPALWLRLLMNAINVESVVYMFNVGNMSAIESYESPDGVIVTEDASALEGNDICFTYCKSDCDSVIVLTKPLADPESFLVEVDALIQLVCERSRFDLAILALVGDSVYYAGSLPIRDNDLYTHTKPMLLGRCEEQADTVRWKYFAKNTTSAHADAVNAAMFENFPYTMYHPGNIRFDGVEGLMVEEIIRSMGVRLNREVITWANATTIENELYERLYSSTRSDLVFGGFLWNASQYVEYTKSYGMVHVAWIVPMKTNVSLRGLITPFSANVWYAILCALLIGGLTMLFLIRDISFLDLTGLILGVPTYRQPTRISSRIQFIAWTLFGFFITQLYLGSLADQLINVSDLQIETMEELTSSGLMIGGTSRFAQLLETPDKADEDNDIMQTIRENYITFEQHSYIRQLQDIVAGRNTELALIVTLNLSDINSISNVGHAHVIKETLGSYPLALATWQDFPYLRDVDFKIQMLLQTGIVNYWSEVITFTTKRHTANDEDSNSNLDLKDIAPAFFLLVIGYLSGCCLLFAEIIFYPSKIFL